MAKMIKWQIVHDFVFPVERPISCLKVTLKTQLMKELHNQGKPL